MKKLSDRNKIQRLEKSDRVQRAKNLIDIVRRMDTDGFVCDSVFECDSWEKYGKQLREDGFPISYCPFCGRALDWDWPRLKK